MPVGEHAQPPHSCPGPMWRAPVHAGRTHLLLLPCTGRSTLLMRACEQLGLDFPGSPDLTRGASLRRAHAAPGNLFTIATLSLPNFTSPRPVLPPRCPPHCAGLVFASSANSPAAAPPLSSSPAVKMVRSGCVGRTGDGMWFPRLSIPSPYDSHNPLPTVPSTTQGSTEIRPVLPSPRPPTLTHRAVPRSVRFSPLHVPLPPALTHRAVPRSASASSPSSSRRATRACPAPPWCPRTRPCCSPSRACFSSSPSSWAR